MGDSFLLYGFFLRPLHLFQKDYHCAGNAPKRRNHITLQQNRFRKLNPATTTLGVLHFCLGAKLVLEMGSLWAVLVALSMTGLCLCLSQRTSKMQLGSSSTSMTVGNGATKVEQDRVFIMRLVLWMTGLACTYAHLLNT